LKILYDLIATQPVGSSPVSGGGQYAERIFEELVRQAAETDAELLAVMMSGRPIRSELLELAAGAGVPVKRVKRPNQVLDIISDGSVDVFYSALPLKYRKLNFPESVLFIYTIHGLRSIELIKDRYEHKYFYSARSILKYLLVRILGDIYVGWRRRDLEKLLGCAARYHVIVDSVHTFSAIQANFPTVDTAHLSTLYCPALRNFLEPDTSILEELGLKPGNYYLLIMGNRWGKNAFRAVRAYQQLLKTKRVNRQMVVTGKGRAGYLRRLDREPGFVVTGYLPSEHLQALYANAFCFVFPTLNEGFGYPPLECMRYGTPVIASANSSQPELLGDAVLWADPYSIMELATRMLQLNLDPNLAMRLREEGIQRYRLIHERQKAMLRDLVSTICSCKQTIR